MSKSLNLQLLDLGQPLLGFLPLPLVLVVLGRQRDHELDVLALQRRPQPLGRIGQRRREVIGTAWWRWQAQRGPMSARDHVARPRRTVPAQMPHGHGHRTAAAAGASRRSGGYGAPTHLSPAL